MGEEPHGRGMAWATLLVSGGISWGVNLWHAFDQAEQVGWWFAALATMYGTAPVVLAAFQSHSAAFTPMGWRKRALTYLLVLLGMVLSVQAQAEAVAVFAGVYLKWIFPVFVDLSAFLALHTLMSSGPARSVAPAADVAVPVRSSVAVLEDVPVRESGPGVGVPVRADGPRTGPVAPVRTEPVPVRPDARTGPPVPPVPADQTADRTAEPVPDRAAPDRTAGPDRPERTTSPVPARALALANTISQPAPTFSSPLEQTEAVADAPTPSPSKAKAPAVKAPAGPDAKDGDAAALEQLDVALRGVDPAVVSIGQVRKALGGAGFARGRRVHALWVETRTGTGAGGGPVRGADRTADRSEQRTGTGRTGTRTGTATGPDRDGTADQAEEDEGADRSADRVPVPA